MDRTVLAFESILDVLTMTESAGRARVRTIMAFLAILDILTMIDLKHGRESQV